MMNRLRPLIFLLSFVFTTTLNAQTLTVPAMTLGTTTVTRQVPDTAGIAKAVRDSLRSREAQIRETYNYMVYHQGHVSDLRRLALRSDIYRYTDSHLPISVTLRAEREAVAYADSLRDLVLTGNFDELLTLASDPLRTKYDVLLRKKCGKAYELAGSFDLLASDLDKYQRKVKKQKDKLTPDLRAEVHAEIETRLPDLQATKRAERIDGLRRDPMVYEAFETEIWELHQQVEAWCAMLDDTVAGGLLEKVVNPWFMEHFETYTTRVTGPLETPKLTRTVSQTVPVAGGNRENVYTAAQVARQATYSGGAIALQADVQLKLRKPEAVRRGKVSGTVVVRIIVEKNGTFSDPTVVTRLNNECDVAALEAVKSLTRRFKPALNSKGQAVRQYFMVRVRFEK